MPQISVRMSKEQKEAWEALAERECLALQDVIRQTMDRTCSHNPPELSPAMRKVGEQIEVLGKQETAAKARIKQEFGAGSASLRKEIDPCGTSASDAGSRCGPR